MMETREFSRQLKIKYSSPNLLIANAGNARTHSRHQIRQIANSIKQFGFTNPVLVDQTNMIIAGHGRVAAAALLGLDHVPTIQLEGLTCDELRAYIVADNRLAEKAGWDSSILAIELQQLLTVGGKLDVTITGFNIPEIDVIIDEANHTPDKDDSFIVEAGAPPKTQLGDLWLLGKHRLLCGNSLDGAAFKTLMSSQRADVVFVDPPYNVAIAGNVSGNGSIRHREFAMASGEMNEAEYVAFLKTSLRLLARHSADGSVHYICVDWRHVGELLVAGKQIYEQILNLCVWVKNNGGMGSFYRSQHELIFVFKNGRGSHRNNVQLGKFGRSRSNIWQYPNASTLSRQTDEGNLLALHPTVKPVALVADAILDCSARGDLVVDAFLGSGTTLIASQRVGRTCYAIEFDPLYVDVAIRRWQRYTGDRAIHSLTGKSFDEIASRPEAKYGR
jgi:DNA modification methylase